MEAYRSFGGRHVSGGPCNERRVALRRVSYEQETCVRKAVMGKVGASAA